MDHASRSVDHASRSVERVPLTERIKMVFSKKFDYKYMNIAAAVAGQNDACLSRSLGTIIVDPNHKIRGTGMNGVPHGLPHSDTVESIDEYLFPLLTNDDWESLGLTFGTTDRETIKRKFIDQYNGAGICPRKILGCESGQRPTLCNCIHSEINSLTNAACDVSGCVMYTSSPIPCIACTGSIINARIAEVHCYNIEYHSQSVWMFKRANIALVTYEQGEL